MYRILITLTLLLNAVLIVADAAYLAGFLFSLFSPGQITEWSTRLTTLTVFLFPLNALSVIRALWLENRRGVPLELGMGPFLGEFGYPCDPPYARVRFNLPSGLHIVVLLPENVQTNFGPITSLGPRVEIVDVDPPEHDHVAAT